MYNAWNLRPAPMHDANPIAHHGKSERNVVAMGANVLPRYVGTEFLIAIRLTVEYQAYLPALPAITELSSAKEDAELERHVEPRQPIARVKRGPREIVDSELALANDRVQFVDTHLGAVIQFQSASRDETAVVHRENESAQELLVPSVERNVDEDRIGWTHRARTCLTVAYGGLLLSGWSAGCAAP